MTTTISTTPTSPTVPTDFLYGKEKQFLKLKQRIWPEEYGEAFNKNNKRAKLFSIAKKNKALLRDFLSHLEKQNYRINRKHRLLEGLAMVLELYGKADISKATVETISKNKDSLQAKIVEHWPPNPLNGDATTAQMRMQELKQFLQYVHGLSPRKKEFPECVSELYLKQKKGKRIFDLPSEEKVAELIRVATDDMYKAFYFTLYNSAGRLGEIATLKVKDVIFTGAEALIRIRESKTDQREVVLLDNTLLVKYLAIHPHRLEKDFQERLFFVSIHPVSFGKPLNHAMVSNNLKKTAKKVGINRIHLHELRHWKASHLTIRGLSDNQLKVLLGHSYSSKATARYLHVGGGDVANSIRKIYNKNGAQLPPADPQDPKKCSVCGTINAFTASTCALCKRPLGVMERMKVSEDSKTELELMREEMRLLRELVQRKLSPENEVIDVGQLHAIIQNKV